MKRKIYVASSWRNEMYPSVVAALLDADHEVFDFRNPCADGGDFHWSRDDCAWRNWNLTQYARDIETHPIAAKKFELDKTALDWSDTLVLVLPCGRSAHLEAGYACGQGKDVFVLLSAEQFEPELMYLLTTGFVSSTTELLDALKSPAALLPEKSNADQ
jgi:hypothetical protein